MTTAALVSALPTADELLKYTIKASGFTRFRETVRSVRGCLRPVWLAGSWSAQRSDGTPVKEHSGQIAVACNNRRESVCPSCAARYAGDAYQLVKAGLSGGKGVPDEAARHLRLFVTLTGPSFGAVHTRTTTTRGRVRRCTCGEVHHQADTRIGSAVDPDSYDYAGAVLWNAHAGQLWHRFRIYLARLVAASLGIKAKDIPATFRLSYSKVAEYQRRGLVHFHAVIRLDGPDGPGSTPPAGITAKMLDEFIRLAVWKTSVEVEATDTYPATLVTWGRQVQIDPIAESASDDAAEVLADQRVAGYIAKYSTKGTGATEGTDNRIRSEAQIDDLEVSGHHRRMIRTAWRLGLRRWAHMLGFGGHFLTKSKYYSTTFTALRGVRAEHQRAEHLAALGIDDTDDVRIVNDWTFTGIGWGNAAQRELAEAMAERHQYAQRIEYDARKEIDGGQHG
ncbi:replication initiator [Saccharopolyspora hattusasensis]|uniref:replication initiator n=1 Tax=Saccharopolyspora hattusasensis TaxID=1128679 RepID=UPI003D972C31